MFVRGNPFELSVMFGSKTGALPSEAPFRSRLLALPVWPERPARDKYSSLLGILINYVCKTFYNICRKLHNFHRILNFFVLSHLSTHQYSNDSIIFFTTK